MSRRTSAGAIRARRRLAGHGRDWRTGRVVSGEVVNLSLSGMKLRSDLRGSAVDARDGARDAAARERATSRWWAPWCGAIGESIGVEFLKMSDSPAGRFTPFVSRGDHASSLSARVHVSLPIRVEGVGGDRTGHTVDLSGSAAA